MDFTDPAGLAAVDPMSPQTWNRYAYLANIPVNATDPLGLFSRWSDVVGSSRNWTYYNYDALYLLSMSVEKPKPIGYINIDPKCECITDMGILTIYPQASLQNYFNPGDYFNQYYRNLRQKQIDATNHVMGTFWPVAHSSPVFGLSGMFARHRLELTDQLDCLHAMGA